MNKTEYMNTINEKLTAAEGSREPVGTGGNRRPFHIQNLEN